MSDILRAKTTIRKCKFCGENNPHTIRGVCIASACIYCIKALSPVPPGMKRCAMCLEAKDVSCFSRQGGRWFSYCKQCFSEHRKERHDYAKSRDQNLRTNYGISQEEYDLMFFQQDGVCAICHQPETVIDGYTGKLKALSVDHNHENGDVRELLCQRCNHLLGWLEKNPQLVKNAVQYLDKHSI